MSLVFVFGIFYFLLFSIFSKDKQNKYQLVALNKATRHYFELQSLRK